MTADELPCWELPPPTGADPKKWKFCAALANGEKRCRKGRCVVVDAAERREAEAVQGRLL